MRELWRAVPGWEGAYEVSDRGRVRSLDRVIVVKNPYGRLGERKFKGRVLRPSINLPRPGYPLVSFTAPGRKRAYRFVHDLVLLAFVGPKPRGLEVCHYNGIKEDNRLKNLRYDTRKANGADTRRLNAARKAA